MNDEPNTSDPANLPSVTLGSGAASGGGELPPALALADVEAIIRILDLAISNDVSPAMRRRAIVEGIARLIDADTWIWIRYRVENAADPRPVPFDMVDGGYRDEAERTAYITGSSHEAMNAVLNPKMIGPEHRTTVMHEMLPPAPQNDAIRERWQQMSGMDDFIVSTVPLGGLIWSGMAFNRRLGRPKYTPRELAIVHVVMGQLKYLHHQGTDVPANSDTLVTLSPRERQVLIFLLGGDSAKEVAAKLRLSTHTVSDHIKAIYRRLNVRTRPELMNLFMSGGGSAPTSAGTAPESAE